MNRIYVIIILVFVFACSGCTTTNSYKALSYSPKSSVLVIGIEPKDFLVQFNEGADEKGYFVADYWGTYNAAGWPTEGYLVLNAKPGATIALTYMRAMKKDTIYGGSQYCARGATPVFSVGEGEVVYVTNVTYSLEEGRLHSTFEDKFEEAAAFIQKHHPELSEKLMPAPNLRIRPASLRCSQVLVY